LRSSTNSRPRAKSIVIPPRKAGRLVPASRDIDDEEHRHRPMFLHPVLNRTIIVKHHPRPGEFEYSPDRGAIVTKVIFPFDPNDLDLGGQRKITHR